MSLFPHEWGRCPRCMRPVQVDEPRCPYCRHDPHPERDEDGRDPGHYAASAWLRAGDEAEKRAKQPTEQENRP